MWKGSGNDDCLYPEDGDSGPALGAFVFGFLVAFFTSIYGCALNWQNPNSCETSCDNCCKYDWLIDRQLQQHPQTHILQVLGKNSKMIQQILLHVVAFDLREVCVDTNFSILKKFDIKVN